MQYHQKRFSCVPWLADAADLRPMGEPETVVESPGLLAIGFVVPWPFGKQTAAILRVTAAGESVTLAIADSPDMPRIEKAMDMSLLQSNPRRARKYDPYLGPPPKEDQR